MSKNPMFPATKSFDELNVELADLKAKLEDAEQTIEAIRSGEVDALVVCGESGEQVFTLKGADEPYRIFVEQMQEGAATLDCNGVIMYCNLAFAKIVGVPLEHVIGKSLVDYLPIGSAPFQEIPRGMAETNIATTLCGVPVLCSISAVEMDSPAAFAVTFTDVTVQKQNEESLKRATSELEGFCYSVSHDMRAPLRSMVSGASIVLEDFGHVLPTEATRDLNRIISSANYLGKLMDDLLSYSRLARQDIQKHSVDLTELARFVIDELEPTNGKTIRWHIEPGLAAQGDPRFLELVLQNLFSNAVKFSTHHPEPEISFGHDRDRLAFFVRDNGIGFEMQYVSKLFEPFERLHGPNEYPGTGIGLANVKRIVTRHAGRVWADSYPGKGATFYFTLGEN